MITIEQIVKGLKRVAPDLEHSVTPVNIGNINGPLGFEIRLLGHNRFPVGSEKFVQYQSSLAFLRMHGGKAGVGYMLIEQPASQSKLVQTEPPPMTGKAGIHIETNAEAQKARVELRSIKYAAFASQETNCFSAKVYIDGKLEGVVDNDGHGGCNSYSTRSLETKLEFIAKAQPKSDLGKYGSVDCDPDILIGDLFGAWLEQRDLKRLCKKKTLFRLKSEKYAEGEYRTVKAPFSQQVREYLVKKYGADLGAIVNETISPLEVA